MPVSLVSIIECVVGQLFLCLARKSRAVSDRPDAFKTPNARYTTEVPSEVQLETHLLLHSTFQSIIVSDLLKFRFQDWKTLPPQYVKTSTTTVECNEVCDSGIISLSQTCPWSLIQRNSYESSKKLDQLSRQWLVIFFENIFSNLSKAQLFALKVDLNKSSILERQFTSCTKTIVSKEVQNYLQDSIAIIGYSCRFPAANNGIELWELLRTGGDGISQIPFERLTQSQLEDPRMSSLKAGFLKCPIDEFDAKFFGISPREAVFMDPQQRLLVEVAWEALENSGINPHSLKGSNTGVFTGVWTHEYETLLTDGATGAEFNHVVLGNAYSATSARVSYLLGLNGPNIATESGCSSSMVSLHLACQSLRREETPLVLVGGVNLLCKSFDYSQVSILAKDGHCKTFDEKADGFARGEGVGVLVLKKYADAVKDGDRVMAIVRGTGISNEGTTNSFGTPSKYCQQIAIKEALKDARVDPLLVDYVEAHGTGTPIGDPIEFSAIAEVYKGERKKPLIVGSIKTNIGHSESAAGLAGILKVIMAMENELIPQHRNLENLNPNIDLDSVPAIIPTEPIPWPKNTGTIRFAGVSSFGISGTNVHAILQEPPHLVGNDSETPPEEILDRQHECLTLSAKSEIALNDLVEKYISYFNEHPNVNIKDIAFAANSGRAHFKHKIAVVGISCEEMKANLKNGNYFSGCTNTKFNPVVAFLFTGQGSQYFGMARNLYETTKVFKTALNCCAEVVRNNFGISLFDILWKGDSNSIDQTRHSQIAIFCVEYGLLKLWESFGIKPDFVMGHSVGEFVAATAAGVLSFQEALILVSERSRLIQNLSPGGMLVVRAPVEQVQNLIDKFLKENQNCWLDIAVINSDNEVVVAGKVSTLSGFSEFLKNDGNTKSQLLAASHAFHSRDMDLMLEAFGNVAKGMNYREPKCNYISGSSGKILQKDDFNFEYWQKHVRDCVDFTSSAKTLAQQKCNLFIEIGAHPVLLALTMTNMNAYQNLVDQQEKLWLPSIRKSENEWTTLLSSLAKLYIHGFDIDWKKINSAFGRKKIELPTYPFQRKKFWPSEKNSEKEIALGGMVVHPLLGSKIPSAGNEHIFQNYLSLQNLPYLRDHQVANIVILPGAGFLEIILAAGRNVFQSLEKYNNREIFLKNFLIDSPLELEEGSKSTVQTVAVVDKEKDEVEIKVYLHCNMNGYNDKKGWKCNASAKVALTSFNTETLPLKTLELEQPNNFNSLDLESVISRCELEISTTEYYKKIPEVGIFFGKTFQSVSKVWKGESEALTLIPIPESAGCVQDYIYHPIVLDAMIQSYGITLTMGNDSKKELYLPVGIDNFQMLSLNNTSLMYAHVTWNKDTKNGHVALYDEFGKLLALMDGVRLVKTSLTSFLNAIISNKNQLPGMYTEIYRGRDGPFQNRVKMTKLQYGTEISSRIKQQNPETDAKENDRVAYLEILKVLLYLGWKNQVGIVFTAKEFMTDLIISPTHEQFVERMLEILCEENILDCSTSEVTGRIEYTIKNTVPSIKELETELEKLYNVIESRHAETGEPNLTLLFKHCSVHLAATLLGSETGVSTLFGGEVDPFSIYSSGKEQRTMNNHLAEYIAQVFQKVNQYSSDSTVRILEVGAGTGVSCSHVVSLLQTRGIPFRYTYTDIGQHFLDEAKIKYNDYSGLEYRLLNIEKDPKLQGFSPYHYDVVIASNVIHATSYITQAMQNIRHLMVPGGILCLIEIMRPVRYIDLTFGVLEGYWCFKDYDLRPSHPTINQQKWETVLTECNFTDIACPYPQADLTLLLAKATDSLYTSQAQKIKEKQNCFVIFDDGRETGKILEEKIASVGGFVVKVYQKTQHKTITSESKDPCVFYVNPGIKEEFSKLFLQISSEVKIHSIIYLWSLVSDTRDQKYISLGFLQICKAIISLDLILKCFVVTRGIKYIGDQKTVNAASATMEGMIYTFMNEAHSVSSFLIDLDPDNVNNTIESLEIFHEVWANSKERCVAFRNTKKYIFRATNFQKSQAQLRIPPQQRYCLTIPSTKNLNDVAYKLVSKTVLLPNEVEVSVRATALNFRDILVILKPEQYHTLFDAVGTDFSGIVTDVGSNVKKFKTGDKIFGISNVTSIASHVVVPEDFIMIKPKEFTFADASTLPSVFLTAYYCLFNVAGLIENETILIHVASGGVGLVATQLAMKVGANIIAKAGSSRKRAYLRSIGIKHVFHSRDISYGKEIDKVTGGKGVDMVLNSITGVNFKETTLKVCAKNARFVEMGKVNIWQPEDVANLRPDVKYTIVDLEKVNKREMNDLMSTMDKLFKSGTIEPLPYTRFDCCQIKEALNYFLKAQHIGKIVVTLPEFCNINGQGQITRELSFNSESTYLITGALGGIGLEVAKWMSNSGARNLVLVGRNPPDEKAAEVIRNVKSKGCRLLTFQVDVGNWDQCKNLFNSMTDKQLKLPPLRGVIHSAGALSDGFIKDQSWEKLQVTYNAKVNGGWNLHELTKNMRLEHFVLFSSAASTIGAIAQINHASANSFLNSLAHHRYSLGLPTQTIIWGAWSDIGAATNSVYGKEGAFGSKPFTPVQGIASLKYVMSRPCIEVMVAQFDVQDVIKYLPPLKEHLEEITVEKEIVTTAQQGQKTEMFWSEISVLNLEERTLYLKRFLEALIRKTLKLPDSEQIDEHQTYSEMGLDSLMAMEMRNKMQHLFGKYLTIKPTSLLDYPNLAGLSRYLAELTTTVDFNSIDSNQSNKETLPISNDLLQNLMHEDCILPQNIESVRADVLAPSKIRKLLITGATGHVGVHFLCEFAKNPNLTIFCLVRAKTVEMGRKRLSTVLKKFDLLSLVDLNKIEIVIGNVTAKNLGLKTEGYKQLCCEVDAIVHCAAKVNHMEHYHKHKTFSDIRSVNRLGLIHVLELASTVKTKHLIYPGSVSSANEITEEGYLAENLPTEVNTGEGINVGYGQSKFVCEKLIRQAIDRGIPCRVFRFPTLTGDSESGHFTLDTNLYMSLVLTFCQLEMIPKVDNKWYSIPIDIAMKISCSLIFNDEVESGLYNIIPSDTLNIDECDEVAELAGFSPKLVSLAEFEKKMRSGNVRMSMAASYFSENENIAHHLLNSFPAFKLGLEHGKDVYCKSSKVEKYIPNFQNLIPDPKTTTKKLIEYAKSSGMLEYIGINPKP